ncbi:P1 family peptidase [Brucella intermedia]|uniref:P1 family peptidase n=1 Tax=Brucella intermedia TaxID=94625 RepID=UPI003CC7EE50
MGVLVQSNFGKRRTDTGLLLHQLKRLARPVPIGIGGVGGFGGNGSGDIFIAFSTANEGAPAARRMRQPKSFPTTRGTR